jgi:hypothetical protein
LDLDRHRRSVRTAIVLIAAITAGCQFAPGGSAGPGDGGPLPDARPEPEPDAPPMLPDASLPDGPPPEPSAHLLLTEVRTQPLASQFIEIFNPMSVAIPLDDYYLSDDPLYARLPEFVPPDEAPVTSRDGIMRFPPGSMVMPGQVIVLALDEDGFRDAFGTDADFALTPASTPVAATMIPVADGLVPLQLVVDGEPVVLFTWDGLRDLVTDVDIVLVGNDAPAPGADNGLPDKSEIAVDGPDEGTRPLTYEPDAAAMISMSFRATVNGSYKRIAPEGSEEPRGTSNGIAGHDETSEDTLATWTQTDSAPTPGVVPSSLVP